MAHGVLVDGDERVDVLLQGLPEQCLAGSADIAAEALWSLKQHARLADGQARSWVAPFQTHSPKTIR